MKVLFTMDSLYNGGTEKSLLDIASRFRAVEPVFCCFYEHRHLAAEFERAGLRVHFLGMRDAYGFRKAARFLRSVLREERPDLVVASLLRTELVTRWVCRGSGVPVVGTFVNDTYSAAAYASQTRARRWKGEAFRLLNRVSARWCRHFISNSRAIGLSNARALGIPLARVSVVPRGRDETVYAPPLVARTGPIRTLVSVARLLERKGQLELVRAFARAATAHPDARLLVAGDGPFRATLAREIRSLGLDGRVELLGNVADVPALLRGADLFVFPSHYEGFSGALVEAMLAGLPIVASSIPMNLEAVEEGHTALTFPATDEAALAERLAWCLDHPRETRAMGARAREVALSRFTLDEVASRFEALLLWLGGARGSDPADAARGETAQTLGAPGA